MLCDTSVKNVLNMFYLICPLLHSLTIKVTHANSSGMGTRIMLHLTEIVTDCPSKKSHNRV